MVLVEFLAGFITDIISQIGYFGVFFLMLLESALLPVPSEVIMPFSGFLVATGQFSFFYIVLAGTVGNLVGSLIAYYLGSYVGRSLVLKYGKYVFIDERHLNLADNWFQKFGDKIILVSRNLPAVRTYISLPAGIAKMNVIKFSVYTTIGSIPWNIALAYIGVAMGQNWETILKYTLFLDIAVGVAVLAFIVWFLRKRIK